MPGVFILAPNCLWILGRWVHQADETGREIGDEREVNVLLRRDLQERRSSISASFATGEAAI